MAALVIHELSVPEPSRREVFRYLGYKGTEPDEAVKAMAERCIGSLKQAAVPRCVSREFPLEWDGDQAVLAGMCIRSKALRKNLQGCGRAIIFAATLGIGPDRLITRASVNRPSEMAVYQAAAAAMIEAVCDQVNRELAEKKKEQGFFLRPRFSPGYGDFPLEHQEDVLRILNASKEIGITLTDSYLMVPSKSVTALIGVTEEDTGCPDPDCENCGKTDCEYRL